MHSRFRKTLAAGLLAAVPAVASAADSHSLGDFGAWQAYSYAEADGKVCYASAAADRTEGGAPGRKPTYLAVTHRAKSHDEVSVTGTYGFKADADAELQIGGMKYAFFTRGDSAWSKQAGADKSIVAALEKGREVVVRATPAKGRPVIDIIPLAGFAKALAAIDKACGVKR
jgi:invasion protein IalB